VKTARVKENAVNQCVTPSSNTSHSVDRTLILELLKVNLFPELESMFCRQLWKLFWSFCPYLCSSSTYVRSHMNHTAVSIIRTRPFTFGTQTQNMVRHLVVYNARKLWFWRSLSCGILFWKV